MRLVPFGVPSPCRTTDATGRNVEWWEHVVHGAAYGSSMGDQTGGMELGDPRATACQPISKAQKVGCDGGNSSFLKGYPGTQHHPALFPHQGVAIGVVFGNK